MITITSIDSDLIQQAPKSLSVPQTTKADASLAAVSRPSPDEKDSGRNNGNTVTPLLSGKRHSHCTTSGRPVPGTSKYGELLRFDHFVAPEIVDQYRHVSAQIEPELVQHMRKHYRCYRPIVIRLMVLGKTPAAAKPWFVVFCDKKRESRVRDFFRENFSRALEQSCSGSALSREALILPLGVQRLMDEKHSVLTNPSYIRNTLCGAIILVSHKHVLHRATFGGLVKVGASNSDFKLFGLTVDHVFTQLIGKRSEISADDDESDSPTDDTTDSDDASVDEHDPFESLPALRNPLAADCDRRMRSALQDPLGSRWYISEHCEPISIGASVRCTDLDFALFELGPDAQLRPNRIRREFVVEGDPDLSSAAGEELFFTSNRDVVINVSSDTPQSGTLIALPCSIWIDEAAGFVQAHSLQMAFGSSLERGHSGGWVVERHTSRVFGHVIASDFLGDGYVIPILNILARIRAITGADVVDLATTHEVAYYQGVHSRLPDPTRDEDEACPTPNSENASVDRIKAEQSSRSPPVSEDIKSKFTRILGYSPGPVIIEEPH